MTFDSLPCYAGDRRGQPADLLCASMIKGVISLSWLKARSERLQLHFGHYNAITVAT
jgi:hypothetical protein